MTKITEQQFLEMEDRERDAFIDKRIVGIVCRHQEKVWYSPSLAWECDSCGKEGEGFDVCTAIPFYSTDYNAMHRVIEKMESDGWGWTIHTLMFNEPDRRHKADFYKHESDLYHYYICADARIAVYLAAGRALGRIE
jgi:hypothetical protein